MTGLGRQSWGRCGPGCASIALVAVSLAPVTGPAAASPETPAHPEPTPCQISDQLGAPDHPAGRGGAPGFVANVGQLDHRVLYYAAWGHSQTWATRRGLTLRVGATPGGEVVHQEFVRPEGPTRVQAGRRSGTRYHGVTPAGRYSAPSYHGFLYRSVWPGIDVRVKAGSRGFKTSYILRPGASVDTIRLGYSGATRLLRVLPTGALSLRTRASRLLERAPTIYQMRNGRRVEVPGRYRLHGHMRYGFRVGAYDPTLPLVIDPSIVWARYVGGGSDNPLHSGGQAESINDVASDASGVYLAGSTVSSDFPGFDPTRALTSASVAVVTKLDHDGDVLWATSLGTSTTAAAYALAVGPGGETFVTGRTIGEFPVTDGAAQTERGIETAFVSRLDPQGRLRYSTLLGGRDDQAGLGIAVNAKLQAVVVGETTSLDFPTAEPVQAELAGAPEEETAYQGDELDAFVTLVSPDGTAFAASTYLGGAGDDRATDVDIDDQGAITVVGTTTSPDFPGADARGARDDADAFVARLSPDARVLLDATTFGGQGDETAPTVDVTDGRTWFAGRTDSTDLPTERPFQATLVRRDEFDTSTTDAYVAALASATGELDYATYLGGTSNDSISGLVVDPSGVVVLAGSSMSVDLPGVPDEPTDSLVDDAFAATVDIETGELVGATRVGGSGEDRAFGAAPAPDGTFYVAGTTTSPDLGSATNGRAGADDGFLARLTVETLSTEESGDDPPRVWADLAGPTRIRTGTATTITVAYGNSGDRDAHGVPLWIAGIPADAEWSLGTPLLSPTAGEPGQQAFLDDLPRTLLEGRTRTLPLLLPVVPAHGTEFLTLTLTVPEDTEFELRVWTDPPYFGSPINPAFGDCLAKVVLDWFVEDFIPDNVPVPVKCQNMIRDAALDWFERMPDSFFNDGEPRPSTLSNLAFIGAILETVTTCVLQAAGELSPAWKLPKMVAQIIEFLSDFGDRADKVAACIDGYTKGHGGPTHSSDWGSSAPEVTWPMESGSSVDPNDKRGSPGSGDERFIRSDQGLSYAIQFENLPAATAPAQIVVVEDVLDEAVDLTTLKLGPVSWADQVALPAPGAQEMHERLPLDSDPTLAVQVDVELDAASRTLRWSLTTVDAVTGAAPADPFAGFLPPNTNAPEGQGAVVFHADAVDGLSPETEIENDAAIIFDQNDPIRTPTWTNTTDDAPPTSRGLSASQDGTNATVTWEGDDEGSGIALYDVYVSEDDGPFTLWLRTDGSSGVLPVTEGTTYAFYVAATDGAGNVEVEPRGDEDVRLTAESPSRVRVWALGGVALAVLGLGLVALTVTRRRRAVV